VRYLRQIEEQEENQSEKSTNLQLRHAVKNLMLPKTTKKKKHTSLAERLQSHNLALLSGLNVTVKRCTPQRTTVTAITTMASHTRQLLKEEDWLFGNATTSGDPDGLLRRLQHRWKSVECHYTQDLAPPKIQAEQPLISPNGPALGVLVDAARHYFPPSWLYGLVDFLSTLGYTLIHFRLSDDQSFCLQLNSHPALSAHPGRPHETYAANELRQWVIYAKSKGMQVIPELNVPSHAGALQSLPLQPCADFICQRGYSIPLNVENHTLVVSFLESMVQEVLDIFEQPPYLHLGGDEVHLSQPCLDEVHAQVDLHAFEYALANMLAKFYALDRIVRWESQGKYGPTGISELKKVIEKRKSQKRQDSFRAGKIVHWWRNIPPLEEQNQPFLISTDLYFDVSLDRDAFDIYTIAKGHAELQPLAIIPATFELGPCTWNVRNVWGKLLAVAMAVGEAKIDVRESFLRDYRNVCRDVGMPTNICESEGKPLIPTVDWKKSHDQLKLAWTATICDRLTYPTSENSMQGLVLWPSTDLFGRGIVRKARSPFLQS
jgi:hypothetical protein